MAFCMLSHGSSKPRETGKEHVCCPLICHGRQFYCLLFVPYSLIWNKEKGQLMRGLASKKQEMAFFSSQQECGDGQFTWKIREETFWGSPVVI